MYRVKQGLFSSVFFFFSLNKNRTTLDGSFFFGLFFLLPVCFVYLPLVSALGSAKLHTVVLLRFCRWLH